VATRWQRTVSERRQNRARASAGAPRPAAFCRTNARRNGPNSGAMPGDLRRLDRVDTAATGERTERAAQVVRGCPLEHFLVLGSRAAPSRTSDHPQDERRRDPAVPRGVVVREREPEPKDDRPDEAHADDSAPDFAGPSVRGLPASHGTRVRALSAGRDRAASSRARAPSRVRTYRASVISSPSELDPIRRPP
jgi:hypothetical protein